MKPGDEEREKKRSDLMTCTHLRSNHTRHDRFLLVGKWLNFKRLKRYYHALRVLKMMLLSGGHV